MKREFVPLAQPLGNQNLAGLQASVKLDGMRATWIPPTRGMVKETVPFANKPTTWVARDAGHIATGLWSRNGNIIHASNDFLEQLPDFPVDLELYMGAHSFQALRSVVSKFEPDFNWGLVDPCYLDIVDMRLFLQPGHIRTRTSDILIGKDAYSWWRKFNAKSGPSSQPFKRRLDWMQAQGIEPVPQFKLPSTPLAAAEEADRLLDQALAAGCEGLVLRQPFSTYRCARTPDLLKLKPVNDGDGVVLGYVWGKEPDMRKSLTGTAQGSRLGAMGGVWLDYDGKRFILSGTGFLFTECQMVFKADGKCASDVGIFAPGTAVAEDIENPLYPRGSVLTFKYRSFTDDGKPVEARFDRRRC